MPEEALLIFRRFKSNFPLPPLGFCGKVSEKNG